MLEVSFHCPFCSRPFLADCPLVDDRVPQHRDPLLGVPCHGSGAHVPSFLEIPEHPHTQGLVDSWPTYRRRS